MFAATFNNMEVFHSLYFECKKPEMIVFIQSDFIYIKFKSGQPGWLSGLAPPSAQGMIPETWDQVQGGAPCMEPASPSACVSASLFLCVSH